MKKVKRWQGFIRHSFEKRNDEEAITSKLVRELLIFKEDSWDMLKLFELFFKEK